MRNRPRLLYNPLHIGHTTSEIPLLMRTPRIRVPPLSQVNTFTYVSQTISGKKTKLKFFHEPNWLSDLLRKRRDTDNPPLFEIGESS